MLVLGSFLASCNNNAAVSVAVTPSDDHNATFALLASRDDGGTTVAIAAVRAVAMASVAANDDDLTLFTGGISLCIGPQLDSLSCECDAGRQHS